ncbi:RHS repeat-associated core domain-containing protein [Labilibaculum manganireducens]|uniref:RHS repeat-associated core domain-containing protein n=1 Tax=Labilibaculum manganireducens TaxID=1940525 RepID=UPI0029F5741D|nr:RHS repeat-associated core domain-containing protein [Labilibaculum manganireducens]
MRQTETSQKRYKYVGKERDEETGLYYYGFRYYAAWLCRFVSVDPLQFDYPHYTPFQYAGNKPITYIDLDGLEELDFKSDFNIRFGYVTLNSGKKLVSYTLHDGDRPINQQFTVNSTPNSMQRPIRTYANQSDIIELRDKDYFIPVSMKKPNKMTRDNKAIYHFRNNIMVPKDHRENKASSIADFSRNVAEFMHGASQEYAYLGSLDIAIQYKAYGHAYNTVMENRETMEDAFLSIKFSSDFKAAVESGEEVLNMGIFVSDVMQYIVDGSTDCVNFSAIGYSSDFKNYRQAVYQTGSRLLSENPNLNYKIPRQQTFWNSIDRPGTWLWGWEVLIKQFQSNDNQSND